jgi:thioredoxin reductase
MMWSTKLSEIKQDSVLIGNGAGEPRRIRNDHVFIFAGGQLPTEFLRSCGVEIDTKFGEA